MVAKFIILLILGIIASAGVKGILDGRQEAINWKNRHTIENQVKRAKAEGKTKLVIPGPIIEYPSEGISLNEAIRDYSVLVAEPLAKQSYLVGPQDIITWYKFRTVHPLSRKTQLFCDTCTPALEPPQEMLPLGSDEFFVAVSGGTLVVDGFEVTMKNSDLLALEYNQRYLLFVSISPSGVAEMPGGPKTIFQVNADGSLTSSKSNRMNAELVTRFDGKLDKLKSVLMH